MHSRTDRPRYVARNSRVVSYRAAVAVGVKLALLQRLVKRRVGVLEQTSSGGGHRSISEAKHYALRSAAARRRRERGIRRGSGVRRDLVHIDVTACRQASEE